MIADPDKPDHDGSYRTLFAQPHLVQQFLEAFAPPEVVQTLCFDQMSPMGTTFLAQNLARRTTDCIWKIPTTGGNPLFLCLLIEFQSSVDTFMAVRVATYVSLLYEHLINTDRKTLQQMLPPVLPIVLYNGHEPWSANREVANFIPVVAGSPLERLQLQMAYLLVDVVRLTEADRPAEPNLVSTLFEMEQASQKQEAAVFITLFDHLAALTDAHPARVALRRAFVIFFNGVLRHRGILLDNDTLDNLMEIRAMFPHYAKKDFDKGLEQGIRRGALNMVLNLLAAKFGADEGKWRPRLEDLDEEQLNAFVLRLLGASSEEALDQ